MLVNVDDIIIVGNDISHITAFKEFLHSCLKLKDLSHLKYFLGLEVTRSKKGISLFQRKYALKILKDIGFLASRPIAFPMKQHLQITTTDGDLLPNPSSYRCLIGRLIYLTIMCPDIAFFVQVLRQFLGNPRKPHLAFTHCLLYYLKKFPGQGILLSSTSPLQLRALCDSVWAHCKDTRQSITRYCIILGLSPIS